MPAGCGAPVLQGVAPMGTMVGGYGAPVQTMVGGQTMVGSFGAPVQTMVGGQTLVGGQTMVGGYGNQFIGSSIVGEQTYETFIPEVVKTTGTKIIEVPQMTVMKQLVPEITEQIVERRVQNIIQEVEKRIAVPQIQTVERIVEVPQLQQVEKIVEVPQLQIQEVVRQVMVAIPQEVVRQVPVPQVYRILIGRFLCHVEQPQLATAIIHIDTSPIFKVVICL